MRLPTLTLTVLFLAALVQGCAGVKSKSESEDPGTLVREVCASTDQPRQVRGTVWMKARSKEASGQFPATVQARKTPGSPAELRLEVTQLLGARAALIEIRGKDFSVETPGRKAVNRKAVSWGGIPLAWASRLFLDQFPCPEESQVSELRWSWLGESALEGRAVDSSGDTWRFDFRSWNGKPWVESVSWKGAKGESLTVSRDDPDPTDGWARRWEARSTKGEVKVRWKTRNRR